MSISVSVANKQTNNKTKEKKQQRDRSTGNGAGPVQPPSRGSQHSPLQQVAALHALLLAADVLTGHTVPGRGAPAAVRRRAQPVADLALGLWGDSGHRSQGKSDRGTALGQRPREVPGSSTDGHAGALKEARTQNSPPEADWEVPFPFWVPRAPHWAWWRLRINVTARVTVGRCAVLAFLG